MNAEVEPVVSTQILLSAVLVDRTLHLDRFFDPVQSRSGMAAKERPSGARSQGWVRGGSGERGQGSRGALRSVLYRLISP